MLALNHTLDRDSSDGMGLIYVWDDTVRDELFVLFPVFAIPTGHVRQTDRSMKTGYALLFTILVIPPLPMNEQYREIYNVEIRDGSVESRWERPRERHEKIAAMK